MKICDLVSLKITGNTEIVYTLNGKQIDLNILKTLQQEIKQIEILYDTKIVEEEDILVFLESNIDLPYSVSIPDNCFCNCVTINIIS